MIMSINVLLIEAGFPLVRCDGHRLDTLREDFYDNAFNSSPDIVSAYDIALSGGEPYSVWN